MTSATDYNCQSQQFLISKGENWPVRTSCPWRDSNMAPGRIPRGFRSAADGAGIAQLPATKANSRRRTFWKHSAILGMPAVATGRLRSAFGMQCDSPSPLRPTLVRVPVRKTIPRCRRASWFSIMSANAIIGPSNSGDLEFDLAQAAWLRQHHDARIQKMAECFLESYLKKKSSS